MAELIDRRDIVFAHKVEGSEEYKEGFLDGAMCVLNAVDEMPTIEAKPVVHAHWKKSGQCNHKPCRIRNIDKWTRYNCSECGYGNGRRFNTKYCPNCGAQMHESISCGHEDDNHIAEDGKKGVKIPVISMEDVPKIMEEMEK